MGLSTVPVIVGGFVAFALLALMCWLTSILSERSSRNLGFRPNPGQEVSFMKSYITLMSIAVFKTAGAIGASLFAGVLTARLYKHTFF